MGKSRRDRSRGAEIDSLTPHSFRNTQPIKRAEPLKPRNERQKLYANSILHNTITFGLGPAGTGKTFVAASIAAEQFAEDKIERIIVTRPAVEAGESLGYLPGELGDKIDPYFVPVREVLQRVLGPGRFTYAYEHDKIQFVPLAYMRGRTFTDAIVILDEAQNTTPAQMKMFLTRLGERSRLIVNGDLLQSDIQGLNGLRDAKERLQGIPGIGWVTFRREDVVRHGLVRVIAEAYENPDDDDQPKLPGFITGEAA